MTDEKRKWIFGSKHPGYMLVLDPGGPKFINGQYIPKMPFKGVTFSNGVFDTEDSSLAEDMMKHPQYKKDFWEITRPEDAKRVNPGKIIEVSEGVRGTSHLSSRK